MIVLDTHIILWEAFAPAKLSKKATEAIEQEKALVVCDITFWEIVVLVQKCRIESIYPVDEMINSILHGRNFIVKNITPHIAKTYNDIEYKINKDAADRLIYAAALAEKIPLVTADKYLRDSSLTETIW